MLGSLNYLLNFYEKSHVNLLKVFHLCLELPRVHRVQCFYMIKLTNSVVRLTGNCGLTYGLTFDLQAPHKVLNSQRFHPVKSL